MKRRRFKQTDILEDRLEAHAIRLRAEAEALPPGPARDNLLRLARQAETSAHMSEWLRSPGLQSPTQERKSGRGVSVVWPNRYQLLLKVRFKSLGISLAGWARLPIPSSPPNFCFGVYRRRYSEVKLAPSCCRTGR